jgi:CheY-like chemotaxis protein
MAPIRNGVWLIVEDDENDFTLFRVACLRAFGREPFIHREADGAGAAEFLRASCQKPQLIVSDLKMPGMNGLELLSWVRQQLDSSQIPFVILSNSEADSDVEQAQKLGADQYRVKPLDLDRFAELVKELASLLNAAVEPADEGLFY